MKLRRNIALACAAALLAIGPTSASAQGPLAGIGKPAAEAGALILVLGAAVVAGLVVLIASGDDDQPVSP